MNLVRAFFPKIRALFWGDLSPSSYAPVIYSDFKLNRYFIVDVNFHMTLGKKVTNLYMQTKFLLQI